MKPLLLVGTVDLEARSSEAQASARCTIAAYNGGVMRPGGFGPLVIDLQGLELSASVPLLADHSTATASVLGSGVPRIQAGKLSIDGSVVRSAPAAGPILALATQGHKWGASVGVEVKRTEQIRAGITVDVNGQKFTAGDEGLTIVRAGVLKECSIVAIGADATASATIAASATGVQAAMQLGAERERERIAAIDATLTGLMHLPGAASLRAAAVSGTIDSTTLSEKALHMLRTSRPNAANIAPSGDTAAHEFMATAEAALLIAAGRSDIAEKTMGAPVCESAHRAYGGEGLGAIVRAHLERSGTLRTNDSPQQRLRAGFSSSDIPNLLSNVANKILLSEYRHLPATWRSFATVRSSPDLKDQTLLRSIVGGTLEELAPTGEIKHSTLGEEKMGCSLGTFAKMLSIPRKDLINDDLGALQTAPAGLARMAARTLNDAVWSKVIATGGTHFTAGRKNYATGAETALSIDSLAALVSLIRQQKDSQGYCLDLAPAALVVPSALEWKARAILSSAELRDTTANTKSPTGNPMAGLGLKLEIEPRLDANSTTAFYLFGPAADSALIVIFLQGQEAPTIETADADFDTLGVQMRCFHDWGITLGDYRAAAKSKGSA